MNRTGRITLAAVAIALALAGAGGSYYRRARGHEAATAQSEVEGQRLRWPAGAELRYRLSWRTASTLHVLPGAGTAQGRLDSGGESALEGTLVLKVARADAHKAMLLASFADLTSARFVVAGRQGPQVIPEHVARAELVGPSAVLEIDDRGRLVQLRAPKDSSGMFVDVMHALATELAFELPHDGASLWRTDENTMTGLAQNSYRSDVTTDGTVVERRRDGYAKVHALRSLDGLSSEVEGVTRLGFDKDRVLVSVDTAERVHVGSGKEAVLDSSTELSLSLSSRGVFVFGGDEEIAGFQVHAPGQGGDPRAADRALAGKFGHADLLAFVSTYAAAGSFERGQLARAAAYLRLHPEECATLEKVFDERASESARGIVFDVLTSAGSEQAQTAMRRLLETPGARASGPLHRMLVQRFALVGEPTPDSVRYLRELEARATASNDGALARAALVSRGSALRRRVALGDRDAQAEARELLSRARGDHASTSPEDRDALVKAIGNLRQPEATSVLSSYAKDENAGVRASVARALGSVKDAAASKLLFDMMRDGDPYVARSAIDAHLGRRLTSDELGALAAHVRSTATNAGADPSLAAAIVRHANTDVGAVKAILEALLARAPQDSEHAARLRAALEGLST